MNEINGYVKLYRQMLDWEWYTDPPTLSVFLYLLLNANYRETRYKGYAIHVGQVVTGRKAIAEKTGLSEQQVRTALKHLKSTNEITITLTNRFSIITIENWRKYQVEEGSINQQINQQSNQQLTNNQPTTNQQLTTPEESKESKNEKNNNIYPSYDTRKSIIDHLNERTGKHFKVDSGKTTRLLQARFNEGFTEQDCIHVIDVKCDEWGGSEKMSKYLRPETLFGPKFEGYLNQEPEGKKDDEEEFKIPGVIEL